MQEVIDGCTTISISSDYGHAEETDVKRKIELALAEPELEERLSDAGKLDEEILREQLEFARELVSSIQDQIKQYTSKSLKADMYNTIASIRYDIDNSMFEI